jgi:hypothetical protein
VSIAASAASEERSEDAMSARAKSQETRVSIAASAASEERSEDAMSARAKSQETEPR